MLDEYKAKVDALEAGEITISEFNRWFSDARWEANSKTPELLHLGWGIQGTMYEWEDFPFFIKPETIVASLKELLAEYEQEAA